MGAPGWFKENSGPVVVEVLESETNAFDAFDQIIDRLCRPVRGACLVPGCDLGAPTTQCPSQCLDLNRVVLGAELTDDLIEQLTGGVRVGMRVIPAHGFFREPCHPHLPVWVTGLEESQQLGLATSVEAFSTLGQQASAAEQRIVLVATMTEGLVLGSAAAFIETLVGQLDDMERIGNLDCCGE